MWDFLSGSDWSQTTWMRLGFAVLIFAVGYFGTKALDELRAIRNVLQEINAKTADRFVNSE